MEEDRIASAVGCRDRDLGLDDPRRRLRRAGGDDKAADDREGDEVAAGQVVGRVGPMVRIVQVIGHRKLFRRKNGEDMPSRPIWLAPA